MKNANVIAKKEGAGESRKSTETLRSLREKWNVMLESLAEGITVTDLAMNILETNAAALRIHGFSRKKELVGRNALEFFPKEEMEKVAASAKRTLETGFSGMMGYKLLKKNGEKFDAELNASLLKDENGNPVGFIAIVRDVTEHKKAEEEKSRAVRELEAAKIVEATVNAMGDGVVLYDLGGKVIFVNPAFERLTCSEKGQLVGRKASELMPKYVKKEDIEKARLRIAAVLSGKIPPPLSLTFVSCDGRETPVYVSGSFVRDANGKPVTVVATFKDISALKKAEEELKEKIKEMEKVNKIMVGRELRMAELKEKIRILEERLEKKAGS